MVRELNLLFVFDVDPRDHLLNHSDVLGVVLLNDLDPLSAKSNIYIQNNEDITNISKIFFLLQVNLTFVCHMLLLVFVVRV